MERHLSRVPVWQCFAGLHAERKFYDLHRACRPAAQRHDALLA